VRSRHGPPSRVLVLLAVVALSLLLSLAGAQPTTSKRCHRRMANFVAPYAARVLSWKNKWGMDLFRGGRGGWLIEPRAAVPMRPRPRRSACIVASAGEYPRGCLPWDGAAVPPQIYAVGMNYASHASELGKPVPSKPIIFAKGLNTMIGTGEDIVLPSEEVKVDYEGELACILGPKPCKDVSVEHALSYVQGYCIANDVSGRSWQFDHFNGGQWIRSKSFDTFLPLGPKMFDSQDIRDPQDLRITTKVNGQVVQDCSTSDMIFTVAEIISFLSIGSTLLPGTIILTGTPAGVGHSKSPARYLEDGDEVEVSIEGMGRIVNRVRR